MPSHGHHPEIKALIDSYVDAVCSKDLDRLMTCYADDAIAYDMMPPLEYRGAHAYREAWALGLSASGSFTLDLLDPRCYADGDVGFAHALARYEVVHAGERIHGWFRWTAGLRRLAGTWKIIHEHSSVPVDVDTQRALVDLRP